MLSKNRAIVIPVRDSQTPSPFHLRTNLFEVLSAAQEECADDDQEVLLVLLHLAETGQISAPPRMAAAEL